MSRGNRGKESIAYERIEKLLNLAEEFFEDRPELAHRYVELAWKIKLRYNIRLSKDLKLKFCRKCRSLLVPSETCRVRLQSSRPPHLAVTCLECGYVRRISYKDSK